MDEKELRKKHRENLVAIDEWCKILVGDDKKMYFKASRKLWCNNRYYTVHVSKSGISAISDGKYSTFLRVSDGTLLNTTVGAELIHDWKAIKESICAAKKDYMKRQEEIMNFIV